MIDLYKQENTMFDKNGDMTLKPSSATVTVELNGAYLLNIIHPYDSIGRWKYIKNDVVIKANTPTGKQLFRVYKINKGMLGLEVQARHIFFDLVKKNLPTNTHINNKNGQEALNIILNSTKYSAHSDIVTITDCYFFKENIVSAINGENENTFINRWGGEIFLDNFNVYVNSRVGNNYGVKISYGNNMEDINFDVDIEGVITRLYPYIINETTDTIELPEKFVDSPNIEKYSQIYEQYIDLSEYMHLKENDDDVENAYNTKEELYEAMRSKCKYLFEEGLDTPSINGTVNMIVLENTEEYKDVKDLVRVGLGDDVSIFYKDIGIETKTRCVGYTWDVLRNKYLNIEFGAVRKDFFDLQNDSTNKLNNILNKNGTIDSSKMQGTINALKNNFKAMRDIAQQQQVRAMLFEDKIKGSSTYGATAIGTMGIMIASERTPDDRDWNWRTFIGGGYAYADWLIGKLKTVLIENMDGSFRIDLNKSGGASFFNDGMLAMIMENNSLNFYNWGKNGDYIGALTSLCQNDDPNKPLIGLVNDLDSAVSIGYRDKKDAHTFHSYIDFDKYNILKSKQIAPIRVFEDVEMGNRNLYNPTLNFEGKQVYNSTGKDLVFKFPKKQGFVLSGTNGTFAWISEEGWSLKNLFYYNNCVNSSNDFYVGGNLKVNGKKNRIVKTELFGDISLNAYETSECYFGDIGRGKLKNGKCILRLDPKYLATVNTNIQYEVRTWAYGEGKVWVETKDMYSQYVIVHGDNDIEFGYEIMAKQKDYENIRLEEESKRKKEGKDENNQNS